MQMGRNIIVWILAIILLSGAMNMFVGNGHNANSEKLAFSEFMKHVENKKVSEVTISGADINGVYTDGKHFHTYAPFDPNMVEELRNNDVKVTAQPIDNTSDNLWGVLVSWFPMLLLIGVWIFFMRQANSGNNKAMSFGKSRARLIENTKKVTFADVAGADEAKQELEEIIDFLKDPEKFQRLGGKIPKGVLMVGPPGTGKTLLAKAVAGEADVPFFSISGSDFVEMFVGVGASRVRDMFAQAKKNAPCLLFIDEIDAVGRHRGAGLGGGNDEREQTLNQLLVEMDGFEDNENVIIIAATNRPDVLDPALLRPGRFDRQVTVTNPDKKGREEILKVHVKKVPLAKDVNLSVIARGTPGFSGADLANLVNEAALLAARKNKHKVTSKDFDDAKDKVLMGSERKSMAMDENEKKLTAYHEAGHAICSLFVEETDPIHKATIIPRGRALGMVQQLPEKDQYSYSKIKMLSRLIIMMGGRVAEELKFGAKKVTSGASSDIAAATNLARSMVTEWGMSEKLGPVLYAENTGEVFLGKSVTQSKNMSEDTAKLVDAEIKNLVVTAHAEATKLLKEHEKEWETLSQALIEYETLTGEEIKDVISGKPIDKSSESPVEESKRTQSSVPEA
ncbi:MAG: ATP-dependent metallopeptidase FtsH/Yme1/Tma family protein [Alphaproteobacteria bacterium]|nr:ATP-dependent metallopeptidase FtsH/Yme1/Tma family protein [Alphaproteobacteria bacterium]